ncbi:histamine H1 receptor isoform X2 [Cyanistes caeruleus]|uniref:histamine H1 receptor isoform X2 n=1 Tax=Cyanistes caeruleus TaxID=156563 RepID=UPI000CDB5770|nr:histamine H1 receptor isoform X2 [Cyanistes caeruleus]
MSNNTTESCSNAPSPLLGLFLGSISLITVVMNILVLCAVKTEKKLQTVGNLYIVSLSVADLMVGAAVMPLHIVYLLSRRWPLGLEACLFWLSMDYVASTASIFNLFILCVDRYRSVQRPLQYLRYRTKVRASLLILGAWLLSCTWLIPILGWHVFANRGQRNVREDECETEFFQVTWFKVLAAILNFYLPSLLMVWFYCRIFSTVRKHCQHRERTDGSYCSSKEKSTVQQAKTRDEKNICLQKQILAEPEPGLDRAGKKGVCATRKPGNKEQPGCQDSDSSVASDKHTFTEVAPRAEQPSPGPAGARSPQGRTEHRDSRGLAFLRKTWHTLHSRSRSTHQHGNRERKAAKQLGVIMAAFMLCWIPYFVLFMVITLNKEHSNHPQLSELHRVTIWLGYVNSTLNPFLYPLCNQNFKKTFKKLLHIH